ncbi:methylated-DNA--[protein]-cysteine S-methyltransferase [Fulvivirga sp. 29W222]|uniref:Methylated-DNA--protein-cysteine methyltransferase n=1 Tax=Fulvivirga marina TaxID=2494733 RepID=A0A937FYG3_9BACT|nr:methylated-DNA--[protein]-cysteine S-methyltransferase [Fulvivirga marina]MBL6446828.1 methylated-DNA--[protein]-cysteine S-methyltransferase [Fulvivirga marina]
METAVYQSPIGGIKISVDNAAITEACFTEDNRNDYSENALINQCINEMDAYFQGNLKQFSIPIKLTGTDFQNRVWSELLKIPFGKTISYSELAIRLGDLKCIRAAGTANGKNKIPIIVPCHRVIGKDGSLVGFAGGLEKKEWLLKHEGIIRSEQMKIFA